MVFCGLLNTSVVVSPAILSVLSLESTPMYSSTNQIVMRVNESGVFVQ